MQRKTRRVKRESPDGLFPLVLIGGGVLAWYLLGAKTAAATPSDTWLYTPTAEAAGVTGGTWKSSLANVATALGLAPAALSVLGSVTGLASKAAGVLFGGGPAATGAAGSLPAAEAIVGLPVAEYAVAGGTPWAQPISFLKDIVSNALFGAGMPSAATAAEMLAQGSVMVSPGVEVGLGFLPASTGTTAGAVGSAAATSLLAYAAPIAAIAAPLSAIIETVFWGYPAEKEAEHKAVEANTGVLAEAPYLVDWIAAHPFDQSFSMYWQAMNELPDAQYGAQKQQFNAAREGTPVPAVLTPVAQWVPSAQEVQNVVSVADIRAQLVAGSLPMGWSPSTPQEQEAYAQWQQLSFEKINWTTQFGPPAYTREWLDRISALQAQARSGDSGGSN